MNERLRANRANWDERTAVHLRWYGVEAFKAGETSLRPIELGEMGDVGGKSLLHLQCHFGMDTLSWARRGARVTGVDFSPAAIEQARALAGELGIQATFVCSDVYDLPQVLDDRFDIVFASYGVLVWLPDLTRWAQVVGHFLRPGGTFYIVDGHPLSHLLDDEGQRPEPGVRYFHDAEPYRAEKHGSYVGETTPFEHPVTYQWQHSLGDIISALAAAGLTIEFLHEWPCAGYQAFPGMSQGEDGFWHAPGDVWPMLYSLKATLQSSRRDL